jgi:hypothetical protein
MALPQRNALFITALLSISGSAWGMEKCEHCKELKNPQCYWQQELENKTAWLKELNQIQPKPTDPQEDSNSLMLCKENLEKTILLIKQQIENHKSQNQKIDFLYPLQ